ncbi:MAG: T9SS type A sorting domain-containing protein [Bacteroidia bacterium]
MRKITFIFLALVFSSASFAQISFDDDLFVINGVDSSSTFSKDVKTYLHNNSTDPEDTVIMWEAINVSHTTGWEPTVCTGEICISSPSGEYSFDLDIGDKMEVKLGFSNFYTGGYGSMDVVAWSAKNPSKKDTSRLELGIGNVSVARVQNVAFSVYPNPTSDFITINLVNSNSEIIKVYDILGNVMISQSVNSGDKIDVSALAKGVYVLRAEGNHNFSKVIQKK